MSRQKAFTLVELLVVIAIISLLISILAPSLNIAKDIAKQVVCSVNMTTVGKAIHLYCNSNDDKYPPYRMSFKGGQPYVNGTFVCIEPTMWASKEGDLDPVTLKQRFRGVGIIYDTRFVESPVYFYCPAQKNPSFILEAYTRDYTTGQSVPWGTLDNSSTMIRMGYFWNCWGKKYDKENTWDMAYRTLSAMESDTALQIDHAVLPWQITVHTAQGVDKPIFNIVFPDGHVEPRASSLIMPFLLLEWGGVLKNWEQGGDNNDWHDLYPLILAGA